MTWLVLLGAAFAATEVASAADPVAVSGVPGITAPPGLARDANGALWVADSGGGVCRLLDPPFDHLEGMVCPPRELQGPKSPGQMALDPASGAIFVGDAASAGGAVWRLTLNQTVSPAFVTAATKLVDLPGDRVLGMAYDAAAGALHYSTKNSADIQRLDAATTCAAPCVATTAGSAVANGALSLAHDGDGRLYLAEGVGVTRIATPGAAAGQAELIPGFDMGTYSALSFDPAADGDGRIYAGTSNPTGADWIDVLRVSDDALVSRYSTGFAGVTAIGIDTRTASDRRLDVADDASAKQVGEDTVEAGRRLWVPFERFERPVITAAPNSVVSARTVAFMFTSQTLTTFWCSLDGAPAVDCGSGMWGQASYGDLAEGIHRFRVQSDNPVDGGGTTHWFEVDTTGPTTTLDGVVVAGASAEISFFADDVSADFACSLDGAASTPCESPVMYTGLAAGEHTFSITATDIAGNHGAPVSRHLTIVPAAIMTPPIAAAPGVTTPVVAHAVGATPWKPGRVVATLRGRVLRVAFDAPPGARYARFAMTRTAAATVRTGVVRVSGGRRNVIQVRLTLAAAKRLQGKRFTMTINAGVTAKRLVIPAGSAPLRIVAALAPKAGGTR